MTWLRDGTLVYCLQSSGWRKGVEEFENRFSLNVQPGRGHSREEAEALAERIAALLPDLDVTP